jgi:DNA (cytosine-5)-methyltransferase 1
VALENHPSDSRIKIEEDGKVQTLSSRMGTGGNNVPLVMKIRSGCEGGGKGALIQTDKSATLACNNDQTVFVPSTWDGKQVAPTLTKQNAGGNQRMPDKDNFNCVIEADVAGIDCRNITEHEELYPTLQAKPNGGQSLNFSGAVRDRYIVRRLTPTECARLQGFPDAWGHIDQKSDFTDEEYAFWLNVRNTHAEINGKAVKDYTKAQMLNWYNKLHTDSAEYKLWGNGIALPCALYVMQGIAEALYES